MILPHRKKDWKLFARLIAGECSEREAAELRAQIAVDEGKARLLHDIRVIWKATEKSAPELDVEDAWQQFRSENKKRAAQPKALDRSSLATIYRDPVRASRRVPALFQLLRVAAVLAVVAIAVVLSTRHDEMTTPEPEPNVFTTQFGERAHIELKDGTKVMLNAGSRLVVPATFGPDGRFVKLEGEAFFDVVNDARRPFMVRAGEAELRVLGTTFGVTAYGDGSEVDVVVAEGRVALRHSHAAPSDTVVLQGHQIGQIEGEHMRAIRQGVNIDRYLAWTEGRLVFVNAPYEEVAQTLERWFDLQIELQTSREAVPTLDVAFSDEPLGEILKVIAATLNLEYRVDGDRVIFYARTVS